MTVTHRDVRNLFGQWAQEAPWGERRPRTRETFVDFVVAALKSNEARGIRGREIACFYRSQLLRVLVEVGREEGQQPNLITIMAPTPEPEAIVPRRRRRRRRRRKQDHDDG